MIANAMRITGWIEYKKSRLLSLLKSNHHRVIRKNIKSPPPMTSSPSSVINLAVSGRRFDADADSGFERNAAYNLLAQQFTVLSMIDPNRHQHDVGDTDPKRWF